MSLPSSLLVAALFAGETVLLQSRFSADAVAGGTWLSFVIERVRLGAPLALCVITGIALLAGPKLLRALALMPGDRPRLAGSILIHVAALAVFYALCAWLFEGEGHEEPALPLFIAWLVSGTAIPVTLLGILIPFRVVARSVWQVRLRFGAGASIGLAVFAISSYLMTSLRIWEPLSRWTLGFVEILLIPIYGDRLVVPGPRTIGTDIFLVNIAPQCSGLEGITVFLAFFGGLIYSRRSRLRLPRALLLMLAGGVTVWIANSVRIAALLVIGTEISPETAVEAFHVNAGWVILTALALGFGTFALRSPWVVADALGRPNERTVNVHFLYIGPLFVSVLAATLVGSFVVGGPASTIAQASATAVVVALLWREYRWLLSGFSLLGVVPGVFGALLWWVLHAAPESIPPRWSALAAAGGPSLALVTIQALAYVITVPLAEELAFRGFVLRRLQAADFEAVDPRRIGGAATLVSSVVFALLHGAWLPGLAAGLLFALVYRWRGRLVDAIVAHATTNLCLLGIGLAFGDWRWAS